MQFMQLMYLASFSLTLIISPSSISHLSPLPQATPIMDRRAWELGNIMYVSDSQLGVHGLLVVRGVIASGLWK